MDKIKNGIILFCLFMFCSVLGCGKVWEEKNNSMPSVSETGIFTEEFVKPSETVDSDVNETSEESLQEEKEKPAYLGNAMVKVLSDSKIGSGVVYKETEEEWIILTAGHVLENREDSYIIFSGEKGAKCASVHMTEGADLAFLCVKKGVVKEGEKIHTVSLDKEAYDNLKTGDFVKAVGSYHGVAEDICEGIVTDKLIFAESLGEMVIMTDMKCFAGMSGSGVFDQEGHFLGIVCAINEGDETAIIPFITVMAKEIEVFR